MSTATQTLAELQAELPSPLERPEADVVIYDGDCGFCTKQVRRLNRWDNGGRLSFISLHDPLVAERYPDLSYDDMMRQMYIVDRNDSRHGGAAAFRYLTRRLPRLWVLAPLLHVPFTLPLWQWGYNQVAKRRYRISGGGECENGSCSLHFGEKK